MIAQVGQGNFQNGRVSKRVGRKMNAIRLDVDRPPILRNNRAHPAMGRENRIQGRVKSGLGISPSGPSTPPGIIPREHPESVQQHLDENVKRRSADRGKAPRSKLRGISRL